MTGKRSLLWSALALMAAAVPASAQVTNGGFELESSAPPAAGDWQYNGGAVRDGTLVHGGSFAANLNNAAEAQNVNVSQQTLVGSITPGTNYNLSFYSQGSYGVAGEGQLQVGFMNAGGGYLPGSPTFTQIPASAGYVLNTRSLTAPAGASQFFIAFNAVTGAVTGASSHLYVDDVTLAAVVVPEPASLAAIAGAGLLIRRRRSA
jgi:hypothetical protein